MLLSHISAAIGRTKVTAHKEVKRHGGIDPGARKRSKLHLTLEEREEISLGISQNLSIREIARGLNRGPSTISREIKRNAASKAKYRAVKADATAVKRAQRPKQCKLALRKRLCNVVISKLLKKWSPEQISLWLKSEYPDNVSMQVSYETIYKTLFIQSRGALKKELQQCLREKRKCRQSRLKASTAKDGRGRIQDAISISERPPEVEDRAIPGHWEGDLIAGTNNSYIATLVERSTRFTVLVKVESKQTSVVVDALTKRMKRLPEILKGSLTWDRGSELQQHLRFSVATNIDVYFCDPRSPWQRGSNENTNRLLRQYFPKGTCLSDHSQAHLNKVAKELNERPRKTLGIKTPAYQLSQVLR